MKKYHSTSLCIPSNRPYTESRRSIESGISYCRSRNESQLVLSDNSKDAEKHKIFQEKIRSPNRYLWNPDANASANWIAAAEASDGDLIGFLADDDQIIYVNDATTDTNINSASGMRPSVVVWDKTHGAIGLYNFDITSNNPSDRLKEYFNKCQGNNTTMYSHIKRNLWLSIARLLTHHPMPIGYYDWAIVLGYIAEGPIKADKSTIYIYDNRNWRGSQEEINSSTQALFSKNGLPTRLSIFLSFFLAIDSFLIINRNDSSLQKREREDVAMFALICYLNNFLQNLNQRKKYLNAGEIQAINGFQTCITKTSYLTQVRILLNAIDEKIAVNYDLFMSRSPEKLIW